MLQFSAKMGGDNEVPPIDSTHSGTVYFSIDGNSVSYSIKFSMDSVTGAHLHRGSPGENGDVILDLLKNYEDGNHVRGSFTSTDFSGPFEGRSIDDLIEELNNGDIYINLHTSEHPDGEIRGQVKATKVASNPSQSRIQPDVTKENSQLVSVIVYNAKKQMGALNICAFDGSERISNCVNANIGKLATSFGSDRFEAAVLKVKTDKKIVGNNDITVCFDPLSEQRYSWGGCWDISERSNGALYTEYDMTGFK